MIGRKSKITAHCIAFYLFMCVDVCEKTMKDTDLYGLEKNNIVLEKLDWREKEQKQIQRQRESVSVIVSESK